jgi:molecular chaperone GrpE
MSEENEKKPTDAAGSEPDVRDREASEPSDAAEEEETGEVSIEALKAQHYKEKSDLKEKMLRIAAEFDNYKKRIQRDIREREERAKADILKGILPTIDNIRRAVEHGGKASDVDSVVDGIRIAEKNFLETLSKMGVQRLESRGKAFDPAFHEAIAQQPSEEFPAGTVVEEVHAGYVLNDKLLRAALVVVSSGKPKTHDEPGKTGEDGAAMQPPEDGASSGTDGETADQAPDSTSQEDGKDEA